MSCQLKLSDGTIRDFESLSALKGAASTLSSLEVFREQALLGAFDSVSACREFITGLSEPQPPPDPPHHHHEDEQYLHERLQVTDATHVTVRSGVWSDPGVWGGQLPSDGARVVVMSGHRVTCADVTSDLRWLHLDGDLDIQSGGELRADTVVAFSGSSLALSDGSMLTCVPWNGAIDRAWDWKALTRGLIAFSPVVMTGRQKESWVPMQDIPAVGSQTITLDRIPVGWVIGDTIVITGSEYDTHEFRTIAALSGATITLNHPIGTPRAYPIDPQTGLPYEWMRHHVANLTRSVVVRSDPSAIGNRALQGHLMFMVGGQQHRWVEFRDLGRTTTAPLTDPILSPDGSVNPQLMPDCGLTEENIRARYAWHSHQAGPRSEQSIVEGCSLRVQKNPSSQNGHGNPTPGFKLGFNNHSSHVDMIGNVSVHVDGSHFFTEDGNEIGRVAGNLAIHSRGSNADSNFGPLRIPQCGKATYPEIFNFRRADLGHRGTGFWMISPGVLLEDNVSAGQWHNGFEFDGGPTHKDTLLPEILFPVDLIPDGGEWAREQGLVEIMTRKVGITWRRNTAYGITALGSFNNAGFMFFTLGHTNADPWPKGAPTAPKSQISELRAWNVMQGVASNYVGWQRFVDVWAVAGTQSERAKRFAWGIGGRWNQKQANLSGYIDLAKFRVDGFNTTQPYRFGFFFSFDDIRVDGELVSPSQYLPT